MTDVLLAQDPTGFSSPWGQAVSGLALLAALVVAVRAFVMNRRK
jgi:hypothetical protein